MAATSVGNLEIVLAANSAGFIAGMEAAKKAMKDAEKNTTAFGRVISGTFTGSGKVISGVIGKFVNLKTAIMAATAAVGAGALVHSLDAAADSIDQLGKASKRLGMSVEDLSVLRFAAGESGVEFESLATMVSKASKEVAQLVEKGTTKLKLGSVSVQLTDVYGKIRKINDLMPDLARGIESASSEAEQLMLAEKIFGRAGADQFVTLLKESGTYLAGMADQQARARRLGAIYNDDQVEKLTAYRDAVGRVGEAWMGVKVKLMTEIAPQITTFLNTFAERTAEIPASVSAFARAFGVASGNDEAARRAGESVQRVTSGIGNVLIASGQAAAKVAMSILTDGIGTLGVTFGIQIMKTIRDVTPSWLKDAIGDAQVGSEAEIERLQKLRIDMLAAQRDLAAGRNGGGKLRFDRKSGDVIETETTAQWLERQIRDILGKAGSVDEAVAVIEKLTAAQQRTWELNTSQVAQQQAQLAKQGMAAIAEAYSQGAADVARAAEQAGAAITDLRANYGAEAFVGPPEPPKEAATHHFASLMAGMRGILAEAEETGSKLQATLDKAWAKAKPQLERQIERRQKSFDDLMKEADQIRFELYPEEKAEAEIQRIIQVRDELIKLGYYSKLSEKDIEAAIAKIHKAMDKAADKVDDTLAGKMGLAVKGFADSASDAFADMVIDGKANFADLAKSWGKMLLSMAMQAMIFQPLFNVLGGWTSWGVGGTAVGAMPVTGKASGGSVSAGSSYWVGERGPELLRFSSAGHITPNHQLSKAGGGTVVQVIDQRSGGDAPKVSESTGPDGRKMISVLIRDEVKKMFGDGSMDRTMAGTFGIGRRATAR